MIDRGKAKDTYNERVHNREWKILIQKQNNNKLRPHVCALTNSLIPHKYEKYYRYLKISSLILIKSSRTI